jgi:hypothetical protein
MVLVCTSYLTIWHFTCETFSFATQAVLYIRMLKSGGPQSCRIMEEVKDATASMVLNIK